ncbi:Hypothetical protein, putative [Bodo saltans]|uniref:Uncharacterized protein n=1 Tax=Bodo saltans TaxID=75058 RepID=A0A0S4JU33_BODSA|nr:Hypothetical protein, putative [Bodo saltans]|eukprot:CUG93732.1 Hypothetical protein, putative [Bodo saltans]
MPATNKKCPPPCSTFDSYGDYWSEENWAVAALASRLFCEPYKPKLLEMCSGRAKLMPNAAQWFLITYQNAYADCTNVTVVLRCVPLLLLRCRALNHQLQQHLLHWSFQTQVSSSKNQSGSLKSGALQKKKGRSQVS